MAELVRWSWVEDNLDDIQQASIEHLELVGAALGLAIAISIPVAILVRRRKTPFIAVNAISGALYTIPSLAMFAFLLSWVGIGFEPAVIALAVYSQLIIRNTVVGLRGSRAGAGGRARDGPDAASDPDAGRAAPGASAIFAGVRLAAVSTVGIATIAVYIGAGGLGVLIVNDGINRGLFVTPIFVGAVIATVMAIVIDLALVGLERALTPWQRARAGAG